MKSEILERLESEVLLFDGAMGTKLQEAGLDGKTAPEEWNLEKPEVIKDIHSEYLAAGSQIIQTNTFGANRIKLGEYDLADQVEKINQAGVKLAREVQQDNYISGSVGPMGKFLTPIGNITFAEAVDIFTEQMTALIEAGVDLISIETMSSLQEIRAAVVAAKEVSDQTPIVAQMTFDENLRTMSGTTPQVAAVVLEALGADIIGANCSLGPAGLLEVLEGLNQATNKPLIVQPNAGLPELIDGEATYQKSPEEMKVYIKKFVRERANIIGGCCGTTPEHIKAFSEEIKGLKPKKSSVADKLRLTSRSRLVEVSNKTETLLIGERINPSSRKELIGELQAGEIKMVRREINTQIEAGAQVLDINVAGMGINEKRMMKKVIEKVQNISRVPIAIDTSDPEVLKVGLETFSGKALINSVSGEEDSLKRILPLAKKYGAASICLTLDETGVPDTAEGKLEIAKKIKKEAISQGIPTKDILIDPLILTADIKQSQVIETLRVIKLIKEELGLKTVLGISNVSHNLPERKLLNRTFLAMALGYGLDAYIGNPTDEEIKRTVLAADFLTGRDEEGKEYRTKLSD